ncbi:TPA: molybdenum cofactor guanylyltransferase [Candidatus Poribacteria bacterium]|nr:molybdenum cofactor guanylyltransferase [Candidatus Poribacteria bacterium]
MERIDNLDNKITGVILAGGKSRRMGYNKALLRIGNQTIIQRVLASLKQVTSSQLIITNFQKDYEFLNIPMQPDILPGKGAFGGIYTGLSVSETSYCLVVACDMPFLNVHFLRYMTQIVKEPASSSDLRSNEVKRQALNEAKGYDIVIPKHSKGYEPLCAIYAKSCLPHIEKFLQANRLKIIDIFPRVRVRYINESEIKSYVEYPDEDGDAEGFMFFNINTQEDYQHALQLYSTHTH